MSKEKEILIVKLFDQGATLENSSELFDLVNSSDELEKFYKNLLQSDSELSSYFNNKDSEKLKNKLEVFINAQFDEPDTKSNSFRQILGFALAACLVLAIVTFISPSNNQNSYEQISFNAINHIAENILEKPESIYISGTDMTSIWSIGAQYAEELGKDKFVVMYALHELNKDNFLNNNINAPRADKEYFLDLALIDEIDLNYAASEVKRRIYCSC